MSRARHPEVEVEAGALPDALPFAGQDVDLVAALDVLEHVDDDGAALTALIALAKPGGHVLDLGADASRSCSVHTTGDCIMSDAMTWASSVG